MVYLRSGIWVSEGHLETGLEGHLEGRYWGHSGQFWSILGHSWTQSEKPHWNLIISLHLAVGRPLWLEYAQYGSLGWPGGYPV